MKYFPILFSGVIIAAIIHSGCKSSRTQSENQPPDMHTSMIALDWQGTYVGLLPCADCEAIRAVMQLNEDKTFEYMWYYQGRGNDLFSQRGTFVWNEDGNSITLDVADNPAGLPLVYSVGEGKLMQHDTEGNRITGDLATKYTLHKPESKLMETTWKLVELDGDPVPGEKNLNNEPYMQFSFATGRIHGNSSCNSFSASFELLDGNRIKLSPIASTKMGCFDMSVETKFFLALEKMDSYIYSGDTLSIITSDNILLARFVALPSQ